MKTQLYLIIFGLLLFSCKSSYINQSSFVGKYSATEPGFGKNVRDYYILVLQEDNTFNFEQKIHDANPKCNGRWYIKTDSLILICDTSTRLDELLSNAYMNKREYSLKILSTKKLKLDKVTFKRQKPLLAPI